MASLALLGPGWVMRLGSKPRGLTVPLHSQWRGHGLGLKSHAGFGPPLLGVAQFALRNRPHHAQPLVIRCAERAAGRGSSSAAADKNAAAPKKVGAKRAAAPKAKRAATSASSKRVAKASSPKPATHARIKLDSANKSNLIWPELNVLTREEDAQLAAFIREHFGGFHAIDAAQKAALVAKLAELGVRASAEQAISMRNYLVKETSNKNRPRIHEYIASADGYTGAEGDIKRISEDLQVSPLDVVRAVAQKKYRLTEIYAVRFTESLVRQLAAAAVGGGSPTRAGTESSSAGSDTDTSSGSDAESVGSAASAGSGARGKAQQQYIVWVKTRQRRKDGGRGGRGDRNKHYAVKVDHDDWIQFQWAVANDMQGVSKDDTMAAAFRAEDRLEAELRDTLKLPVWTEADVRDAIEKKRAAAAAGGGAADARLGQMSTPDFVMRKRLTIGGKTARWLDIKNFYLPMSAGEASADRVARMIEQARRYNEDWGGGAFVFQPGYCEALREELDGIAGVLDGSFLRDAVDLGDDDAEETIDGR